MLTQSYDDLIYNAIQRQKNLVTSKSQANCSHMSSMP